ILILSNRPSGNRRQFFLFWIFDSSYLFWFIQTYPIFIIYKNYILNSIIYKIDDKIVKLRLRLDIIHGSNRQSIGKSAYSNSTLALYLNKTIRFIVQREIS